MSTAHPFWCGRSLLKLDLGVSGAQTRLPWLGQRERVERNLRNNQSPPVPCSYSGGPRGPGSYLQRPLRELMENSRIPPAGPGAVFSLLPCLFYLLCLVWKASPGGSQMHHRVSCREKGCYLCGENEGSVFGHPCFSPAPGEDAKQRHSTFPWLSPW